MKSVFISAMAAALLFLGVHRPASAMVEFCPAALDYQAVGSRVAVEGAEQRSPASLFGFKLTALGARTITSAVLAFDTNAGWFTVSVPQVSLAEKTARYTGPSSSFLRHDFASQVMYVQFPAVVTISHAWVYSASARNDTFGWQSRATVVCDPREASNVAQERANPTFTTDDRSEEQLAATPPPLSSILAAERSTPLEDAHCSEPFRDATVVHQAQPDVPDGIGNLDFNVVATKVEVAVNADGSLADAWTWGPSGYAPFDVSAVRAAHESTYLGAKAYCKPVPGSYFFIVTIQK